MKLTVIKNKKTGQVSINIPKGVSELFGINERTIVTLEPRDKKKNEFDLRIENK